MEEIIYANYIIVGFVNWREAGDQVFWMPFLSLKGSFYFHFLIIIIIDLVFSYLLVFNFIKTFLTVGGWK